jgi:hypothetical protein
MNDTYRCSPNGHGVHVTLALTSTTTVSVVCGVHSQTTDSRPDVEKSATTSLTQLPELPVRVAGHTDGSASLRADPADFTTLKPHGDVPDRVADLILRNDCGVRTSATAEHRTLVRRAANIVHLGSHRHHLDWQAVSTERSLCRQHTRIHHTTHARQ